MVLSTSTTEQPRRSSRLKLAFKIALAGCAAIFILLLIGIGIPIVREISRPITKPNFDNISNNLLVRADSRAPEKVQAAAAANKNDVAMTTQTAAASSSSAASTTSSLALRFKPLIPDTPDVPANIRAVRDSLNARFDKLLAAIEDFESRKAGMSYREARQALYEIYAMNQSLWADLAKIHGTSWRMEGWEAEVEWRNRDYQKWCYSAEFEVNVKGAKFSMAATSSAALFKFNQAEWRIRQSTADPNHPVFVSDFYRQHPEDWDRMIGSCRQVGGVAGFTRIFEAVWFRQYAAFSDGFGRAAWSVSGR